MAPRVAFVTCAAVPELDPDDRLAADALNALGVETTPAVWDDVAVEWAAFDLVVVRSTWDYPARRARFVEWARRVPRLANPADVIDWNTDKRYLADLAKAGVAVVPTTWLAPREAVVLPARGRHVLKPSVGAGSVDAAAFSMHDERERGIAHEHALRLLGADKDVMIQPYLERIEERGESALVYIGGEFSHAVTKGAMLVGERAIDPGGLYFQEAIQGHEPSAAELDVGRRALAAVPGDGERLLYARIDLVPNTAGDPVLLELELTEPSLFLGESPGAPRRFADAVAERLSRTN